MQQSNEFKGADLGAAIGAIHAATQLREAQKLAREAENLERSGERLGSDLLSATGEYAQLGCGQEDGSQLVS